MAWVKITDVFPEDPKVETLSHKAFRLYVTGLCYAARNLTDGHLSTRAVRVVATSAGVPAKTAEELLEAGLWNPNGDGYVIGKYLDYNPSADEVREQRRKRSEAGKRGAAQRWQT